MGMLPLPVETLLRRAAHEKGAKGRHDTAFFAWEASVRLALAVRPPKSLSALVEPTIGSLAHAFAGLDHALQDAAVLAVWRHLEETVSGKRPQGRGVTAKRLVSALPPYRNDVIGHGGVRTGEFYDAGYETLVAGLRAAWEERVFLDTDDTLVYVEKIALGSDQHRRARVLELVGVASTVVDFREQTVVPDVVLPERIYLRSGDEYHPLAPWVLYELRDEGERVLFFNGLRRGQPRYLDYATGDILKAAAVRASFPWAEPALVELFGSQGAEEDEAAPVAGVRIVGDYEIVDTLGQGGMGTVYLARHRELERLVALKMLPRELATDAVAVARFRREVRALARCEHPNVVKVFGSGEAEGTHFFTMELVEGADLRELAKTIHHAEDFERALSSAAAPIRDRKRKALAAAPEKEPPALPSSLIGAKRGTKLRRLVELFRDAALAVQHLHDQGIVHRDIKPANLMVTAQDGRVVVMDLGLAALSNVSQSLTRDQGAVVGTLRYLPPEQLQRNLLRVDHRVDVYALGATFYELLTGQPFLLAESDAELIERILRDEPVAARKANPELPIDVATIIHRATAKDPRHRYPTAAALADDLTAYLESRPITARPPSFRYVALLAARRHPVKVLGALMLLVAVVAGAVGFGWLRAAQREQERRLTGWLLVEQGRSELLEGRAGRALPYLSAAYVRDENNVAVRSLLGDALRAFDAERAVLHHEAILRKAAFSRDGQKLVTVSDADDVIVWSVATAERSVMLKGHAGTVVSAAFNADGSRVVTAAKDTTARVWDVASGRELVALLGHADEVLDARFSPDGTYIVTGSADRTARIWDASSGEQLLQLDGHQGPVTAVDVSPDGRRVLTGSTDGGVRLWDAATGELAPSSTEHSGSVFSACFSPDGTRAVSASEDGTAAIWDVESGDLLHRLAAHTGPVYQARYRRDGKRIITAGGDATARVWDASSGRVLVTLVGHSNEIRQAEFSPDGRLAATAGADKTVRIWDATKPSKPLATLEGHTSGVVWVTFDETGLRLATASWDKTARVWEVMPGRPTALFAEHQGAVEATAFSPDGRTVASGGWDGKAQIWDVESRRLLRTLAGHKKEIRSVAFDEKGALVATGGGDFVVRIWQAQSGALAQELAGHTGTVRSLAFRPGRQQLVSTADDGSARIWDTSSGSLVATLAGHRDFVRSVAFSPDGSVIATASDDATARLWDADAATLRAALEGHRGVVASASFSADGRQLVTASWDWSARLWDVRSGKELHLLRGHQGALTTAELSPDGRRVLTASTDETACIWSAETGEMLAVLVHPNSVWTARFIGPGDRVATGCDDSMLRIWDVATGRKLAEIAAHQGAILSLSLDPDSTRTRVVTGSMDRTVQVWDLAMDQRGPSEIRRFVDARVPWKLVVGQLMESRKGKP